MFAFFFLVLNIVCLCVLCVLCGHLRRVSSLFYRFPSFPQKLKEGGLKFGVLMEGKRSYCTQVTTSYLVELFCCVKNLKWVFLRKPLKYYVIACLLLTLVSCSRSRSLVDYWSMILKFYRAADVDLQPSSFEASGVLAFLRVLFLSGVRKWFLSF
ncbi:hypothetical protein DFH27DRAFT_558831 [Peziza echinospora]|nr:hypothetical protein DFH27DRAFT_558831 [Peziza echinospora]